MLELKKTTKVHLLLEDRKGPRQAALKKLTKVSELKITCMFSFSIALNK